MVMGFQNIKYSLNVFGTQIWRIIFFLSKNVLYTENSKEMILFVKNSRGTLVRKVK